MHFEHLIEINDRDNTLSVQLTHAQLWAGLVRRATDPQHFMPQLDAAHILSRSEQGLRRELHFGSLVVRDEVRFESRQAVHYLTEASEQHGGGSLTMRIESPDGESLFVRFTYDTPLQDDSGETGEAVKVASYVKAAYREADIDTIRLIRELVEDQKLESGDLH